MTKVFTSGCFDPLHRGHIYYLKQARKLGDKLVVIVSSDEKIRSTKKHEPRKSEKERLRKVKSLKIADEVLLGGATGEYYLINRIKPDIIALGYDQKIPEPLKNKVKKYKIITLKPFQPDIFKSSKLAPSSSG